MPIAQAIQDILALDFKDGDPNTVLTRNPNYGWTLSNLPEYTWKSLGTLWIGPGSTYDDLIERIVWEFGEGKEAAEGEITLFTAPLESTRVPEPLFSNDTGAETSYLQIILRQPEGEMSTHRMEQVQLRIKYILDTLWRQQRIGGGVRTPAWVSSTIDPTIDPSILCLWERDMVEVRSTECGVQYIVAYQRNVPR